MSDGKTIIHSLLTAATVTVAGAGIYYLKVALVTEARRDGRPDSRSGTHNHHATLP